ncbi:MAG: PD-(D/E)XK nuclease family protein, partial [Rickettsiales bacterium]|nr:PD-(D/E)XK nuclease family protein [Rickettsiales bacterium]
MPVKHNIFCATNPLRLLDALWEIIKQSGADFSDHIIFLPSRRAVRSVEKMFVDKVGSAVLLPALVALGEGADEDTEDNEDVVAPDVVSNIERVVILSKLLSADPNIRTISNALPIARDLARMQDYLENEGIDGSTIDWAEMVDEKYAKHFQQKANFLDIVTRVLPMQTEFQITQSKKRNDDIRAWQKQLHDKKKVVVCGSTASVPATADLMVCIAGLENGYIILPGKIDGRTTDFELDTNPYNSEYKFLNRIGVDPRDVQVIDMGSSDIDFFNQAFGNMGGLVNSKCHAQLIECARESEEAEAVAEIVQRAIAGNKTVLVITPDAAGNQRIAAALANRKISADFSGGKSGIMTLAGRAILNLFDDWMEDKRDTNEIYFNSSATEGMRARAVSAKRSAGENKNPKFDNLYKQNDSNLFKTIVNIIEAMPDILTPKFQFDSDESAVVWEALEKMSDALFKNGIILTLPDARSVVADALSGVSVRPPMDDEASVCVLGTIESRMQSADVVILTGLNEGMFPSIGYENSWLPRAMAHAIGLPSPDRKVSLMALDFMNLSCGREVYWLRSKTAGSSQTTESRFISRVDVAQKGIDKSAAADILNAVRSRDNVPYKPLDYSAPRVPADRSDVYVTELELLIHNPYAFYVRHILRLYPIDDYWHEPDARDFGNLVHGIIEKASGWTTDQIVAELDKRAREILPGGSVIFHFWHKRFVEIASAIVQMLLSGSNAGIEIKGSVNIAGRNVRAKADRIWDGVVLDIKTGAAPSKSQLEQGNMPQLPLEAYIMQNQGFPIATTAKSQTPVLQFLQLQNGNVKLIEYDALTTQKMIDASVSKVSQL